MILEIHRRIAAPIPVASGQNAPSSLEYRISLVLIVNLHVTFCFCIALPEVHPGDYGLFPLPDQFQSKINSKTSYTL